MEAIATYLRKLFLGVEELPVSVQTVLSNDDLLSEILLRLPAISLVLFKSVSKRWLSLIKDAAFIKRRGRIPNIDPPSCLFLKRYPESIYCTYGSAPFDIRIPSRVENIFETLPAGSIYTTILQSCNGLLLCLVVPGCRFCVYNPTLNIFKMLPEPLDYALKQPNFIRMDFDPTKSPHYKFVHATPLNLDLQYQIQTYSSEIGIWSIVCSCSDPCKDLSRGVYWNNAIHWISGDYFRFVYYKLDFGNKNVVLTKIQFPISVVDDMMSCELFVSRGCLLLISEDETNDFRQLNVYEMRNGCSEWSMKYCVNHTRIALGKVMCIALGEREGDSFMVIRDSVNYVYLYNFVLKTYRELPQFQSIRLKGRYHYDFDCFLFTASFASV